MDTQAYVTIHGKVQGPFRGNHRYKSGVEVHSFQFGVQSPVDAGSGHATGKRQHGTVTVVKEWGASTPQLFQALVADEVLDSVLLEFLDQHRPERVAYTIHLTNATISQVHHIGRGKHRVTFVYEDAHLTRLSAAVAGPVPIPYPT